MRADAPGQNSESRQDERWDAARYARNARFVADLAGDILSIADPRPGEKVLDLGCGDGALMGRIAEFGCTVVGVDSSPAMVEAACAAGHDARQMSGEALAFDSEFDLVFSNAALHWMTEADLVAEGIFASLKPGGRFVAEFGGWGNVAAIATALRAAARTFDGNEAAAMPWYFPSPEEHGARLQRAGFEIRHMSLHPRPTPLATGMREWLLTFQAPFFETFGPDRRDEVLDWVTQLLRPSLADASGNWFADYVRLRMVAIRP